MTVGDLTNTDGQIVRMFVIRHGQTDHNLKQILQGHLDVDINGEGVTQAKLLAERLKDVKLDKLTTSDLVRCRSTSDEILKFHKDLPVKVTSDLREREMGIVQGMHLKEAQKLGEEHGIHFKEFGEKLDAMTERVARQWDSAIDESVEKGYKNYALCTHGGVITAFSNYLYSELHYSLNSGLSPGDLRVPYNTSITIIDINKETRQGTIIGFGDTWHLGEQKKVRNQQLR